MGSYAQMVCDDEIAASVKRLRRGFAVDGDSLAVEVIAGVMQGSRNFLAEMHTVKYLRAGEVMVTHLADRRDWEEWSRSGREEMADRAQSKAERLLAEHKVAPLEEDQEQALDEVMRSAESELMPG
jgi:trimethylamine--corrinoid protein Co-methyltransferase